MTQSTENQPVPPIPPAISMTPMLTQYLEIKKRHPDAILFYRMGDFYEMFFEDAVKAAPMLEVQLTSRDRNSPNPIPMCGVPYHAVSGYLQKLLARGMKVAICEQLEDPSTVKGLVRRDVIRVVTPALIGDPELVATDVCNILVCLHEAENEEIEVCLLDLLRGQIRLGTIPSRHHLMDLFSELFPKEVLVTDALLEKEWLSELLRLFPQAVLTKRSRYFAPTSDGTAVTYSALRHYLKETQKVDEIPYLGEPLPLFESQTMRLDPITLSSLEVIRGNPATQSEVSQSVTLSQVLDYTQTPMGRRTLKEWLTRPLSNVAKINQRLDSVHNLVSEPALGDRLKSVLSQIRDLERLTTKTGLGLAMPRDFVAIREVMARVPELKLLLSSAKAKQLRASADKLQPLTELTTLLQSALEDMPPTTLRDGGIFRDIV